jgi:predicted transcriptional regulator
MNPIDLKEMPSADSSPVATADVISEVISEVISDRLLALRQSAGLTPGKLAQITGVSVLTINLYENPYYEQYDLKTLQKLIEACGGRLQVSIQMP